MQKDDTPLHVFQTFKVSFFVFWGGLLQIDIKALYIDAVHAWEHQKYIIYDYLVAAELERYYYRAHLV